MFVGHTLGAIKASEWSTLIRSHQVLTAASATYASLQSSEEREVFAKELLTEVLHHFEFAADDELLGQLIDVFAKAFAQHDAFAAPPEG